METIKFLYRVERCDLNYIRTTVESCDGLAVIRTVDPEEGLIEARVAPGCEAEFLGLIRSLREKEGIRLLVRQDIRERR